MNTSLKCRSTSRCRQRRELGDGEILAANGTDPRDLSRELSLEEIEEIRNQVPDMRSRSSFTARCAWPTPVAACFWLYQQARPEPGHLHQRLPLEYNVQEGKEDDVGNIVHKYDRFRCKMLSRRWVSAHQLTKFYDRRSPASGRVYDRV